METARNPDNLAGRIGREKQMEVNTNPQKLFYYLLFGWESDAMAN